LNWKHEDIHPFQDTTVKHPEHDSFQDRAKSLEDAFFAERDRELLAALSSRMGGAEAKELLISATGVRDEIALPELAGLPVPQFLAVLGLFPMVEVAWCDQELGSTERSIILQLAHEMGVTKGSPSHELLDRWLMKKPAENAGVLWEEYVRSVNSTLQPETVAVLKEAVMHRARRVAAAEGGILGFGKTVSATEEACLARLERAFDRPVK
jgi:hypothetical protein